MNPYFLEKIIFPFYHFIKKTRVLQRYNELDKNQWLSEHSLKKLQEQKLSVLLKNAYENVPFYRKRFDQTGIVMKELHFWENFRKLPILTKADITDNIKEMISRKSKKHQLKLNSTSGSSGEALYFYTDMHSWAYRRAVVIRNHEWLGVGLGDRKAVLWGAPMDINKAESLRGKLHRYVNNMLFLSSYEMSEPVLDLYSRKLMRFKPKLLTSYPGPLSIFAQYLDEINQKIDGIQSIITSAETLYPWQRELIEKVFDCPVYNRYGCREFGDIAQECPEKKGLHIHMDRVLLEIVDDDYNPVKAGQSGQILITDLDSHAMPFIRYKIGDVASYKQKKCSCGRGLILLEKVSGRTMDIIKAPNGNRLGGTYWTLLLRSQPGFKKFQVVQENINLLIIRYIKDLSVETIDFEIFVKKIKEKCGQDIQVIFENVEDIPTTKSGKNRLVISNL